MLEELKHTIALLLEDAKRLQEIEPNAGTEARIGMAKNVLEVYLHTGAGHTQKETEETITVYGHKVNREFAFYVLDNFNPTLRRIIEEMTLIGCDKKAIEDATTTASSAVVAGINSLMAIALNQQSQKESLGSAD